MGKTHWFLVGIGIIGGAFLVGSLNAVIFLEQPYSLIAAAVMALIGILVIYYGRYG